MSGFAAFQASPLSESPAPEPARAEPVPFWDGVSGGYTAQTQVLNTAAREEELRTEMWTRHRALETRTGKRYEPSRFMLNAQGQEDALAERFGGANAGPTAIAGMDDAEYEKLLGGLGAERDADLRSRVDKRLRGFVAKDAANADSGLAGGAGSFVGHAAGAMTDLPNLVGGLAYGGVGAGRSLATRMLLQGAANAGIEAVTAPDRLADAKEFGGPEFTPAQAAEDVGFAFLGGAGFEAAGSAVKAGGRALIRQFVGGETPHLRRAGEVLDQAARDDLAIGARSGEEQQAAVAALDRAELPELRPAPDVLELPSGGPGLTPTDYRGRTILGGTFDPRELATDAQRFQYKAEGDAQGVTARLKGVEAWDATASGKVLVWEDRAGQRFVADGHQRRALAIDMEQKGWDARLDGYLFREADGWSAADVRTVAALKNIREGSGTALDAAKLLRAAPEAAGDRSLPVSGEFMAQARGLAQLSEPAFRATINKVIDERFAAEIGRMAPLRPDLHEGMVRLLKEAEPANLDEARALVVEALQDDWIKAEGDQADLFGYDPSVSAMIARAKVAAAVKRALSRDARLFGQLVKNADAIEAGGNALARDANEARLAIDRAALEVTSKLALRAGPVGEAMQKAVARVHAGEAPATAAKGVLAQVRAAIEAGERLDEMRGVSLDPQPPSRAAEGLLEPFDDPAAGKGAAEQARDAPEDVELEGEGLFDDLDQLFPAEDRHATALDLLGDCIAAE